VDDTPCPRCGTPNAIDANFCPVCGEVLPERGDRSVDSTEVHTAVVPVIDLDQMGMVVVTSGSTAGARYAITEAITTLGRHPDSSVFLDDVTVSRRHAEIHLDGARHELTDAGSLNGTYVNGTRVDSVVLAEGDQLQIGKFKLVFVLGVPAGDE